MSIPRWTIECRDGAEGLRSLGTVALVCTDPPFTVTNSRGKPEWKWTPAVDNVLQECAKRSALTAVKCAASGRSLSSVMNAMQSARFCRMVGWHKPYTGSSGAAGPFGWQSEYFLIYGTMRGRIVVPDHVECPPMARKREGTTRHPAEMPRKVCRWIAKGLATQLQDVETVCDPFVGSGELLRAFWELGYKCVGFDINPEHAESASRRPEMTDEVLLERGYPRDRV